jgi:hypothetical protein
MQEVFLTIWGISFLASVILDFFLLPRIWSADPGWARHRQLPEWPGSRGNGAWRWMMALMLFDPHLQATPTTRVLSKIEGVLLHAAWMSFVCMLTYGR